MWFELALLVVIGLFACFFSILGVIQDFRYVFHKEQPDPFVALMAWGGCFVLALEATCVWYIFRT